MNQWCLRLLTYTYVPLSLSVPNNPELLSLGTLGKISVKFESKDINFQRRKWICKYWQRQFCLNLNVFTHLPMEKMAADLADGIIECIFLNGNDGIWIQISLKFVPRSPIDKKPVLVQVMNRRQAITWDNDDPPHWCIYASLGAEELTHCGLMTP